MKLYTVAEFFKKGKKKKKWRPKLHAAMVFCFATTFEMQINLA